MNNGLIFKNKISKKMFIYVCSLLILNFLLVSIMSNVFLTKFTISYRAQYLSTIYSEIYKEDYNSEKFQNVINNMKYENIYIVCYDGKTNEILFSNTNSTISDASQEYEEKLINEARKSDYLVIYPSSEYEDTIMEITGRKQQISIIGKYISKENEQILIVQTPYQPIKEITLTVSRFNIISAIIVLIIAIIPTIAFTYFIAKPIKEATKVARCIKNKDFSQRCIIRTSDEIAELEEAINIMADSIKTYTYELESLNDSLKKDIDKRKKMEQAQKEFVSNVSHEIKTPISIISGYAEGLKQGLASNDEERDEYCNIIIDECQRMTSIVVQLLNLSKLENGSLKLNYSNFDINELCENIINKFKLKCQESSININLKENKKHAIVRADYNEIEKVIINYTQNAYKHVYENGTISIIILEEGEYVYIGVNNDGNQIPENEIDKIWDKFYKIDKSHKREENSTGLGLAIVKATMNLHKCPYGVKNTQNGVEFYIKLKKPEA